MGGNKKQAPKKTPKPKTRPAGGYLRPKGQTTSILDQAGNYNFPEKKG